MSLLYGTGEYVATPKRNAHAMFSIPKGSQVRLSRETKRPIPTKWWVWDALMDDGSLHPYVFKLADGVSPEVIESAGVHGSWSDIDDGRGGSIFNRKLSTPEKQASARWSKLTKSAQDLILDGMGFDALQHGAKFAEALALMGSERDRLSLVQAVLEF